MDSTKTLAVQNFMDGAHLECEHVREELNRYYSFQWFGCLLKNGKARAHFSDHLHACPHFSSKPGTRFGIVAQGREPGLPPKQSSRQLFDNGIKMHLFIMSHSRNTRSVRRPDLFLVPDLVRFLKIWALHILSNGIWNPRTQHLVFLSDVKLSHHNFNTLYQQIT